ALGLVLMVVGFGCLQLVLDLGEKHDWFDSGIIVVLFVLAVGMLAAFLVRELMAAEPILDLTVFSDRNLPMGTIRTAMLRLGCSSSAPPRPRTTWSATSAVALASRSPRPSWFGAARSTRPRWSPM